MTSYVLFDCSPSISLVEGLNHVRRYDVRSPITAPHKLDSQIAVCLIKSLRCHFHTRLEIGGRYARVEKERIRDARSGNRDGNRTSKEIHLARP